MKIRWKPVLYPLLVVAVGAGVGSWMISNPSSSLAFAEQNIEVDPLANAPTVQTILPVQDQYAPQLQLYSQLQSRQQVTVSSPAAAEVTAVRVFEGTVVQEGDVIVELDTSNLQRQVAQLQARQMDLQARRGAEKKQYENNVEALKVEAQLVAIAQRSVDRIENLQKRNLTSPAELENAERTLQNQRLSMNTRELAIDRFSLVDQQYQAQLMELNSQIDQAQEQLDDAMVKAPFTAKVSQVQVQVGATVNPGEPLLTLVDTNQQELVAWVSASSLDAVESLDTLEGQLQLASRTVPVTFSHADPAASAGSLRMFFEAQNNDTSLVLNRYYRMWVNLPAKSSFAVPESAVYSNAYVYTLADDRLQRKAVNVVGERYQDGQLWRLVQGELDGEAVLVTRLQNAAQGLAVRAAGNASTLAAAGQ